MRPTKHPNGPRTSRIPAGARYCQAQRNSCNCPRASARCLQPLTPRRPCFARGPRAGQVEWLCGLHAALTPLPQAGEGNGAVPLTNRKRGTNSSRDLAVCAAGRSSLKPESPARDCLVPIGWHGESMLLSARITAPNFPPVRPRWASPAGALAAVLGANKNGNSQRVTQPNLSPSRTLAILR